MLYLIHDAHIDFLPEAGHCRHTRGMRLAHRLLHLLRIGVDYHRGTGIHTEDCPATLKDMGIGQEVHDAVVIVDRHALAISHHGSIKLAVSQDDALRITRRTTGIENVGDIVERGLLLQSLHFNLSGQVLAQFHEIAEIDGIGVMRRDMHLRVEHDDAFQCRTERKDATCLVVLVLFAYKQEAYLGIVDHKLYLLLRTGSIERNGHRTDAPSSEVALDILYRVLREDADVLLYLHTKVQQGIADLIDGLRHLIP